MLECFFDLEPFVGVCIVCSSRVCSVVSDVVLLLAPMFYSLCYITWLHPFLTKEDGKRFATAVALSDHLLAE